MSKFKQIKRKMKRKKAYLPLFASDCYHSTPLQSHFTEFTDVKIIGQIGVTFVIQPHIFTSSANPCCCLLTPKLFCLTLWHSLSHLTCLESTMGSTCFATLHYDNCFVALRMSV